MSTGLFRLISTLTLVVLLVALTYLHTLSWNLADDGPLSRSIGTYVGTKIVDNPADIFDTAIRCPYFGIGCSPDNPSRPGTTFRFPKRFNYILGTSEKEVAFVKTIVQLLTAKESLPGTLSEVCVFFISIPSSDNSYG